VAAFGSVLYGVRFPWDKLPALVITLGISAASFCALGMAIAGLIPNADSAPAIVQFTILPLNFVSNVFINMQGAPQWIDTVSRVFPIRHFADAMLRIYDPATRGIGLNVTDLGVIAGWGVVAVFIALRYFTWEPRT